MKDHYRTFFGFTKEPFATDIGYKEILETPELLNVKIRFEYVPRLGAVGVLTGEVGSGKSTAVRYALNTLHPSEYRPVYITASSGSIMEFYRQLKDALDIHLSTNSKSFMLKTIKQEIANLVCEKKRKVVLVVDEASLIRLEVFAELHTLCQFEQDAKPWLPMILVGQTLLADKLTFRSSQPLASRVVAKCHLEGVDLAEMKAYLQHHLALAGVDGNPFDPTALTAIHQGSGGLFRKANHLARGGLIAAAAEQSNIICAEHIRLAATEIF
ncbi:MAG: AAA family ATPase [Desulfobacteraceae bacterium]|nr:AAA family ATPase [Desulfobacteraceae bacterium]